MFSDDSSIENFKQLFYDFKKYVELQKEHTQLELIEKLTKLFSTLILGIVLIALGMMALFYLLFAFAYIIEPLIGLAAAYGIIVFILLLIVILIIVFRQQLIINPMVNFLANLFFNPPKNTDE